MYVTCVDTGSVSDHYVQVQPPSVRRPKQVAMACVLQPSFGSYIADHVTDTYI